MIEVVKVSKRSKKVKHTIAMSGSVMPLAMFIYVWGRVGARGGRKIST